MAESTLQSVAPGDDMTTKFLQLTLALTTLWTLSCGSNSKSSVAATDECPSDSTLSYDNFGKAFMTSYCTRCHSTTLTGAARNGAPSDHNFDTLAGIIDEIEHVEESAGAGAGASIMPPSGAKPSDAERQQLSDWIACGAP